MMLFPRSWLFHVGMRFGDAVVAVGQRVAERGAVDKAAAEFRRGVLMRHDLVDELEGLQLEFGGSAERDLEAMDAHVAESLDGAEAAVLVDRLRQLLVQSAAIRPVVVETGRFSSARSMPFSSFLESKGCLRPSRLMTIRGFSSMRS